jgi:hypothetical protein
VSFLGERSNPFYLGLNIAELVERTKLNDVQITQHLQTRHRVRVYPGSFVYPSMALKAAEFTGAGLPGGDGLRYAPPRVPPEAPIVYAPELNAARTPMLRLSFGSEARVEPAARALAGAFRALWEGERP